VNREELNWLLQTIKDAQTAERCVLAQYERGRISFAGDGRCSPGTGWINRTSNQFLTTATGHSTGYATPELPIGTV